MLLDEGVDASGKSKSALKCLRFFKAAKLISMK